MDNVLGIKTSQFRGVKGIEITEASHALSYCHPAELLVLHLGHVKHSSKTLWLIHKGNIE